MLINYLTRYHDADTGTQGTGALTETPDTTSDHGTDPTPQSTKTFSQADLDRIVADRLARQKAQYESQQQKAKSDAEQKQLEEQKRFQELAEQRAKELDDIKPKAAQVETYEKLVNDLLSEQKKDLPKHIVTLLNKLDPSEQVAYLKENKADIVKQTQSHDINANNRNSGNATVDVVEAEKLRMRRSGTYSGF